MIPVTSLRSGITFEQDGDIFVIVSYSHLHLRKTSAVVKVKARNIRNGSLVEKSFGSNARVNDVYVEKKDLQFLYKDADSAYFMNPTTFDQITIPVSVILDHQYLKEGANFTVSFLGEDPIAVAFPPKMDFKVIETGPSVRGNSATNVFKDATLENGLKTKVPLFVDAGDTIRVDTRTGEYSEKA